jgi:zinc finger BED domain-containing protein 1 (E3 SUMO-protein ligase ZBED1)
LKPFAQATDIAGGEKYPTLSLIPVLVNIIRSTLSTNNSKNEGEIVQELKAALLMALDNRFSKLFTESSLALKAAAIHPLYGSLPWVSEEVKDAVWEGLLEEALLFHQPPQNPSVLRPIIPPEMVKISLQGLRAFFTQNEKKLAATATEKNMTAIDFALFWWKTVGSISYPHLTDLAKALLAIPATSVPSERVFSIAGWLFSQRRRNMTAENLEDFIFIHENALAPERLLELIHQYHNIQKQETSRK